MSFSRVIKLLVVACAVLCRRQDDESRTLSDEWIGRGLKKGNRLQGGYKKGKAEARSLVEEDRIEC